MTSFTLPLRAETFTFVPGGNIGVELELAPFGGLAGINKGRGIIAFLGKRGRQPNKLCGISGADISIIARYDHRGDLRGLLILIDNFLSLRLRD